MKNCQVKYIVKEPERMVVCVIYDTKDYLSRYMWGHDEFDDLYYLDKVDRIYKMPDSFSGVARCSPDDEWDEALGKKIAYNRAKQKLDESFFKRANAYVNYLDRRFDRIVNRFNMLGTALNVRKEKRENEIEAALK